MSKAYKPLLFVVGSKKDIDYNMEILEDTLEDVQALQYRMEEEGFHYCFNGYSSWKEIKDAKFHELREAYLNAAKELEEYVNKMHVPVEEAIEAHNELYDKYANT